MDDKKLNNKGFSLPELMIGMAILAGATLGASKVMEMMAKSTRDSEIRADLKVKYAAIDKDLTLNMSSLSDIEFNRDFSFYINGNNLVRVQANDPTDLQDPDYIRDKWMGKVGNKGVYTSFSYVKKGKANSQFKKRYQRFFSICVPIEEANSFYDDDWNIEKLKTVTHFPFVKNINGRMSIHCCEQTNPNCDDAGSNPIANDTNYILKIVRNDVIDTYDPDDIQTPIDQYENRSEIVRYIPTLGNTRNITGAGFFFSHKSSNISQGNNLFAYYLVYQSDCLNSRVKAGGAMVDNCTGRVRLEHKIRSFQINSTMGGGANDVGNIGW
jgi:prepilin-type N-terminal cleavage/methylation domain-containing protein